MYFSNQNHCGTTVKDENEQLLFSESEISKRWKKYIETLYYEEVVEESIMEPEAENDDSDKGDHILRSEFQGALRRLKTKKAPGMDRI